MTNDILWVPWLEFANLELPSYRNRLVEYFLRSHHYRGHILRPSSQGDLATGATLSPCPGWLWHLRDEGPVDMARIRAFDGPIEGMIALDNIRSPLLDTLLGSTQLQRLILYRHARQPLTEVISSIDAIRTQWPQLELWIDQPTTSWDTLSYLLATFPGLQPIRVGDDDLDRLLDIGNHLGRRVFLSDFSGKPPLLIPPLNRYASGPPEKWTWDRFPIYPGYL